MSPLPPVLLNVDLGEREDEPPELARLAGMVNIACGGHAGDERTMRGVAARATGVLAAHPSYVDPEGFGRRRLARAPEDLRRDVEAQCARLAAVVPRPIEAMKPHGALYHAADEEDALATAVVAGAVAALGAVAVVGPEAGALARAAWSAGLPYLREGFADRGTRGGKLIPRGEPGALILDPVDAAATADRLCAEGAVDTICVHGDTPGAVEIARAVAAALGRPARAGATRPEAAPRVDRPPRAWRVRVAYQPAEIAAALGVAPEELVRAHTAAPWIVERVGFQPGFPYLVRRDWPYVLPRLAAPRPVEAGTLALAAAYTGVYPGAGPGGWTALGRVLSFPLFTRAGARLRPGDHVWFRPA